MQNNILIFHNNTRTNYLSYVQICNKIFTNFYCNNDLKKRNI